MNYTVLLLAGCLSVPCLLFGQSGENQVTTGNNDMYSTTVTGPDGKMETTISAVPANYPANGSWLPIDRSILFDGDSYRNTTNVLQTVFPLESGSLSDVVLTFENKEIRLATDKQWVTFQSELSVGPQISGGVEAQQAENAIRYTYASAGVTDEYLVLNGELKNNLLLQQVPAALSSVNADLFGFRERVQLPDGWWIVAAQAEDGQLISSDLLIMDENGQPRLKIPAPLVYDAYGFSDGGEYGVEGAFYVEEDNGTWYVSTLVPVSWITSEERAFPITIDPTVTLAATTGGWQSQNNAVDNPGFVFIGVCCGNLEHRAWLKWNVTSIPDNACVTNTELQIYVNGVGAATTEIVHAYDMMTTTSTGLFGPYGGINTAAYNDQGNGYYTSFTLSNTGTYGWYDLGPNADADVMSMINTWNWYQVALVFDNEPSTNWKRLTATSCNLRITYDVPPCVLLPVELTTFEVNCAEGRTLLEWETASELNNDYFTIWRSVDGITFTEAAQVDGQGTTQSSTQYEWMPDTRDIGTVYYRLSQTDFNGSMEYYDAKAFTGCPVGEPVIMTVDMSRIVVEGEEIDQVVVCDYLGRVVTGMVNPDHKSRLELDPAVEEGAYIVSVLHHGGNKTVATVYLKN